MGAAAAEVRGTAGERLGFRCDRHGDELAGLGEAIGGQGPGQAVAQRVDQVLGGQTSPVGDERASLVVVLTEDARRAGSAVEVVADLGLEEGALLLDDDDLLETVGEAGETVRLEGPDHRGLVEADADFGHVRFGLQAKCGQGVAEFAVHRSGRDDADGGRQVDGADQSIESVGGDEGLGGFEAGPEHVLLGRHREGRNERVGADRFEGLAVDQELRGDDVEPVSVGADGHVGVGDVAVDLEADPGAAETAQLVAEATEVEHFLDTGRVEGRHGQVGECPFAGRGDGRGLAEGVVTGNGQHPAVLVDPGRVGVTQGIAAAVDAGALAVPHADHTIDVGVLLEAELLAAPDRSCTEVLVDAADEADAVFHQDLGVGLVCLVHATHRAAPVAGDETGGVQAPGPVGPGLVEQHPHERLDARHGDHSLGGGHPVGQ